MFGRYGRYMFDEELITWSVDGGGDFFYRPHHKFSVTNVCGYLRVLSDKIDVRFLAYFLQALHLNMHFDYTLKAHPSVIRSAYTIDLPPISVQRRISTSLKDIDTFIATLRRLITKKEAIKQGMMQQLLSGKTRLPGFGVEWQEASLGDLAQIVSGGTPKSSVPAYWDGGIAWCTPTDITRERSRFLLTTERSISNEGLAKSTAQLLPKGSLLLCTRATIGELKIAVGPVTTNQGFKSLVPQPGVSSDFLYYKMLNLKEELTGYGTGSTFLEISKRDVSALRFKAPSTEEQKAIAAVLNDADDELDALHVRLSKAKGVKQGMMQELLTGRTRLPAKEGST